MSTNHNIEALKPGTQIGDWVVIAKKFDILDGCYFVVCQCVDCGKKLTMRIPTFLNGATCWACNRIRRDEALVAELPWRDRAFSDEEAKCLF